MGACRVRPAAGSSQNEPQGRQSGKDRAIQTTLLHGFRFRDSKGERRPESGGISIWLVTQTRPKGFGQNRQISLFAFGCLLYPASYNSPGGAQVSYPALPGRFEQAVQERPASRETTPRAPTLSCEEPYSASRNSFRSPSWQRLDRRLNACRLFLDERQIDPERRALARLAVVGAANPTRQISTQKDMIQFYLSKNHWFG